jgi:type IV pilus assembly protein PilW
MKTNPKSLRMRPSYVQARGFSLIELMIALVIGLLVLAAAGGIFIANKRTYNTTETLGRIQENGRVAFEIMARDVREAAGTPCGKNIPIANVLNNSAAFDYNWGDGLRGYDGTDPASAVTIGTATAQRVSGTDAIEFKSASNSGVTVSKHNPASAVIHVNTDTHGFTSGDILIICDYSQASIFQMNGAGNVLHIGHNTGGSVVPGNSCKALSFPVDPNCASKPKDGKQYNDNAVIAKLNASIWYIGNNGRGGRSLFRKVLTGTPEEVTEGVQNMQLTYLVPGDAAYSDASGVGTTRWKDVAAVRIDLTLQAATGALTGNEIAGTNANGTNAGPLSRTLSHVVTLRNRVP